MHEYCAYQMQILPHALMQPLWFIVVTVTDLTAYLLVCGHLTITSMCGSSPNSYQH